jgi:hypothetical protein
MFVCPPWNKNENHDAWCKKSLSYVSNYDICVSLILWRSPKTGNHDFSSVPAKKQK